MRITTAAYGTEPWYAARTLVQDTYARAFGADVRPAPELFATVSDDTGILACAGLTFGSAGPFFSEHYLDGPVERHLGAASPVARHSIVEVGALASSGAGAGLELITAVPVIAWCHGMSHILCTTTVDLRRTLAVVGIPFVPLADARASALPSGERGRWGTYYERAPLTGVIPLAQAGGLFGVNAGRYEFVSVDVTVRPHETPELADACR